MTAGDGDASSGDRPKLRLVTDTGPDLALSGGPETGPLTPDSLVSALDADALGADGDVIELVLGDDPEPDLEFLLVPLLTEAERQMRSIRRPLDAEMWASELLGMLELGAPDDSTVEEREAVSLNLATRLAEYAQDQGSLSGLAILRTLSVIGPPQSRLLARDAAARMIAAGRHDRAWVPVLGRPETGRSWRFRDPEGSQESVTVVFRYGRREHTLTVLIDHVLGGGVKDCWIGEDPGAVLAETRQVLAEDGIEVEFIPIDEATQALRAALSRPECPTTEDEIEDIAMCRALLQARVELLVNGPASSLRSAPGTLEG